MPKTLVKLIHFLGPDYPIVMGFMALGQAAQIIPTLSLFAYAIGCFIVMRMICWKMQNAPIEYVVLQLTDHGSVPLWLLSFVIYIVALFVMADYLVEALILCL